MSYFVKEIYYTIQGEGARTGRPAVFCRFAGCNLWSGREQDRPWAACNFCDTDFVGTNGTGGGVYRNVEQLVSEIDSRWLGSGSSQVQKFVVCTGGEPLFQLDTALVLALHRACFAIAVETNGTVIAPPGIDWLCVSPKQGVELVIRSGQELKIVYPQAGLNLDNFAELKFDYFFLQPMDGPDLEVHIQSATQYCLANPRWRLSLQTHKLIGMP
jgi:7-carboxy-7-deazaguanine synthase